jgi:circadian clock protein KaiB
MPGNGVWKVGFKMSASHQFMLFVGDGGPMDRQLENTLKIFLKSALTDVLDFQVVNVIENPDLFEEFDILSLPTLIKMQPTPMQRFVGDLLRIDELAAQLGVDYPPHSLNKSRSDLTRK